MSESEPITLQDKCEAFICQICFVCIIARRWPDSKFAALVAKAEGDCRFCKAYRKVHAKTR